MNRSRTDPMYGIHPLPGGGFGLQLGTRSGRYPDSGKPHPFYREYFSKREYGTQRAALAAAKAMRKEVLARPEFREYTQHSQRFLKMRKTKPASGVTGLSLVTREVILKNGERSLRATMVQHYRQQTITLPPPRKVSLFEAFKAGAHQRDELEGKQPRSESTIRRLFKAWLNSEHPSIVLYQRHGLPIWPKDLN